MLKVAVIIPAYNEAESIADVVASINKLQNQNSLYTAVVVNDASMDNTAEIVATLNCVLLDLPVNLGIGGAVQTGFIYAYKNGYDYAIQCDGDGQHPVNEIPRILDHLQKNNADVVIGSRFIQNKGFQSTLIRRAGIRYLQILIKLLSGTRITDATSGFRMFNRKVLKLCAANYPDEYPEPESMVLFLRKGLNVKEVPVEMQERQGGQSSIRSFKQLYYFFKVSLAILYTFIKTK